jgi:hypothetical protein
MGPMKYNPHFWKKESNKVVINLAIFSANKLFGL